MKITDKTRIGVDAYIHEIKDRVRIERVSPKKRSFEIRGKEKVELSARAREIQRAKKLIEQLPDIREERVARIKAQVERGTYRVSSRQVADKLLRESLIDQLV